MEEAAASLQQAAQLLPERARVQYNYGLALQFLNQRPGAEAQLLRAHGLDPTDPAILSAVTTFYLQDQNLGEAIRYAERFAQLFPDSPEAGQLVRRLRAQLAAE
jgi:tetratricopeptide (TPR) repeat protein